MASFLVLSAFWQTNFVGHFWTFGIHLGTKNTLSVIWVAA
jgi:hypothetical protein